jgi:hypothetical protein
MDALEKLVSFIASDVIGRVTALLIGIVASSIVYQNLIMVEKNTQLDSKEQLISVKEERIKSVNDQLNVLKSQLSYKPYKDKQKFEDLTQKNKELEKENTTLSKVVDELKIISQSPNAGDIANDISVLKEENVVLKSKLSGYESNVLIENEVVDLGKSWSGFGGVVIFGIEELSVIGHGTARLSVNGTTISRKILPGDQLKFEVGIHKYLLNIQTIEYVRSEVKISVTKQI